MVKPPDPYFVPLRFCYVPALILPQRLHIPGKLSSDYWGPLRFCPGSSPFLSVHQLSRLCNSLTWLLLPPLLRLHLTNPLFSPMTDISQWMSAHHKKIHLDKTELLFLPGEGSATHDLTITCCTTSGEHLLFSLRRRCRFWSGLWSFHA